MTTTTPDLVLSGFLKKYGGQRSKPGQTAIQTLSGLQLVLFIGSYAEIAETGYDAQGTKLPDDVVQVVKKQLDLLRAEFVARGHVRCWLCNEKRPTTEASCPHCDEQSPTPISVQEKL